MQPSSPERTASKGFRGAVVVPCGNAEERRVFLGLATLLQVAQVQGIQFLWAPRVGPYLLQSGLKYGPCFVGVCNCVIKMVYNDSEFGAHTRGPQDHFMNPL